MIQEPNQIVFAEIVAEVLNASDDYNITGVDILDALASAGLKLVADELGDSTLRTSPR